MARPIRLTLDGEPSKFAFSKLDRTKLYGRRRRLVLGPDGEPCEKAALSEDGALIIRRGMTDSGYVDDDGTFYRYGDLVGLGPDGEAIEKKPSTLGDPQALAEVEPHEVFTLAARTVYVLEPDEVGASLSAALDDGKVFRFPFNYRADWHTETAYLVRNEHGTFALVGNPKVVTWSELNRTDPDADAADDELDEDLDFEMF